MNKKGKNRSKQNDGSRGVKSGNSSKSAARLVLFIIIGVAAVLVLAVTISGGFTKLSSPSDQRTALIAQVLAPATADSQPLRPVVAASGSPRVTIVEFGDYQCNSCGLFHKDTKDKVVANLVETGKAGFMFKDFPINDRIYAPRDGSTLAAEAAYCAGDQGKFWQYHDELYNNQEREGIEWISSSALVNFAKNVGVEDIDQFSNCVESHTYRETVSDNYKLAQSLGLNATPTFLVITEGKEPQVIVGAHPYSAFENAVNQMSS